MEELAVDGDYLNFADAPIRVTNSKEDEQMIDPGIVQYGTTKRLLTLPGQNFSMSQPFSKLRASLT